MKKIAVAGIGAMGCIIGGNLTKGGKDVVLIEPFWREHAEVMNKDGITFISPEGEEKIKVKVLLINELSILKEKIDILFISVKSNHTKEVLTQIKPFLSEDAWVISLQNGINEEVLIPIVGKENTVVCISYTGGQLLKPGHVTSHEGKFIIGELDGQTTPRIKELARILSLVKPVEISPNVMLERWIKLSQATMSVPVSAISGLGLGEVFQNGKTQRLLARIIMEAIRVAHASGYTIEDVIGVKKGDWEKLATGPMPEISKIVAEEGDHFPSNATDPITNDIKKGQPLEIDYTNGYVIAKGKELGVPTPLNELVLNRIKAIESRDIKPGLNRVEELLEATNYR